MNRSILHELRPLPRLAQSTATGFTLKVENPVEVSLVIPAKNSTHSLETTVREAHAYLLNRFSNSFEIILVPNPSGPDDPSDRVAESLARQLDQVRVVPHEKPPGKGAALQTGIVKSRGNWIFFTDSDLPYDLDFFDQAIEKLRGGYDLVTGNRRLASSHFHIPVSLLRLAYGRHRLGLGFNALVRMLFPIQTTDTQAGIKAFSRRLAVETFSRQTCPGFLFDLELFLTAHGQGLSQTDLPVTLHLNTEKSTVRILREFVLVAYWLSRIWIQNRRGYYGKRADAVKGILSRYRGADFSTRFFLYARWKLTPYQKMSSKLPGRGKILDLGCGHGLLALTAALESPHRQVLGVDHDPQRLELANRAAVPLQNLRIEKGSLLEPPEGALFSAITAIDVMHYFTPPFQEQILRKAFERLEKGGVLLVREVNPTGGWISRWNRTYEKWATQIGFTQANSQGLHFRTPEGWEEVLKSIGYKVRSERCSSFLFADILYTCERL
ncbi:MAG: glycosyltransferase [Bdellovibrio sp.]|nr:glycosyltransferase [Bdellovibrio sp.]